jgi:hypothetical protein
MHQLSLIVAAAAAIVLAAVGFMKGTYAAGGSDSSCYALMAETFSTGQLRPSSPLVSQVPWPDAGQTFTPGGFVPSETNPSVVAPICAPGFSLLLAPFIGVGGLEALFWVTPLAGALLVWMAFLAGRALGGPLTGAMSAVLITVSPPVLYQVVQPMNDITTAALWMATFVALIARRWVLAGASCGLALLVRPNLMPLALIAGTYVVSGFSRTVIPKAAVRFVISAAPFVLIVFTLNHVLYGGPFRTGYGQFGNLFSLSVIPTNAARYLRWLIETHTPFPLLAFAAPFVVAREKRKDAWLAIGLIVAISFIYLMYTPFDDWSYLRFLLPAIGLMVVLASAVTVKGFEYVADHGPATASAKATAVRRGFTRRRKAGHDVLIGVMTVVLAMFCLRAAADRHAFALQFLEQRYRSAGIVVRDQLPADAVVLSVWDSGAVRFHGRKEALSWEGLDPAWLDRSLAWLEQHGRRPFILVESWEEPGFRSRFANHSDIGKLDWPPKFEIDRVVRIYDPQDRAPYHRGERVDTEFLWPLRD